MKFRSFLRFLTSFAAVAALASCGSYQHVSEVSSQSVPDFQQYPKVSGRPALRVPARMGILTTSRFRDALAGDQLAKLQAPGIRTVMPVNAYVTGDEKLWRLSDLLYQRSKIISETRLLELDLILLCDQTEDTQTRDHVPPLSWLSLGMINPQSTKVHTQLDVALMDARTGYVYGVIGDEGKGSSHSLTFLEADAVKETGRIRAGNSAKTQLTSRFPAFWQAVRQRYGK